MPQNGYLSEAGVHAVEYCEDEVFGENTGSQDNVVNTILTLWATENRL